MVQPANSEVSVAPAPAVASASAESKPLLWDLSAKQVAIFALVVLAANLPVIQRFLLRPTAPITVQVPFHDDFGRAELGPNYRSFGGAPRVSNGSLVVAGVRNNPVWLNASLPQNVRVEVDARCDSTDGDIKVEIFGNGWDHGSGYLLYFGAWTNTNSVIAKIDENAEPKQSLEARERRGEVKVRAGTPVRVERRDPKVQAQRTYHYRIERNGGHLFWYVDNDLFLDLDDPFPLVGTGHDRLGLSSWDGMVSFSNLTVTPL
jgi:hypothetical protein